MVTATDRDEDEAASPAWRTRAVPATARANASAGGTGVLRRLVDSVRRDDVTGLAAELAYRFLFAVFPFGLFVAALGAFAAGYLHVDNPAQQLVEGLGDNLPGSIAGAIQPELERLLGSPRADLLSVGAIAALWAATGGTNALVKGMHRAYDVPESRPFLLRYAIAIGLTILGALGIIAAFVTIVGGALLTEQVGARLGLGAATYAALEILRWPAVFVALTVAVAILYRYAPNVAVPWRWILAGAAAFSLGWLVATAVLGFYVANVADYGATYGSLGGVIVLMLWFYVTALLLLVGAEVTASLAHVRSPAEIRRRREEQQAAQAVDEAADEARRQAEAVGDRFTS
jgi:membrane protein